MSILTSAVAGLLFGFGILVAGMGNPAKVIGFFDFAGRWDPGLAFVMLAAIAVTMAGYRLAFRAGKPRAAEAFSLPASRQIDRQLIFGAMLFGVGWGIAGMCPGGALPMLASGRTQPAVFVVALIFGLVIVRQYRRWNRTPMAPTQTANP